jgi:hypothetical protein
MSYRPNEFPILPSSTLKNRASLVRHVRFTESIAYDRIFRRVYHRRYVDTREMTVGQFELEGAQQSRPDRLDLYVGERFTDATMTAGTERHIAELLFIARSFRVQKPAPQFRTVSSSVLDTPTSLHAVSFRAYVHLCANAIIPVSMVLSFRLSAGSINSFKSVYLHLSILVHRRMLLKAGAK